MRMLFAGVLAAAFFVLPAAANDPAPASPAPAAEAAAAPAAPAEAAPVADPDDNRRVCKETIVTGSRIAARKTCKTKKEWREEAEASKAYVDDITRRALTSCRPLPGGGCS
jgi:hypothetical protein